MAGQTNDWRQHRERVLAELRRAGASWWARRHDVTLRLAELIHPEEHVGGVVCGYSNATFTLLAATDRRILLLTQAFVFVHEDEVSYEAVSGVSLEEYVFRVAFTLHTRIGDYRIRTFNRTAATRCRTYLERRCLEQAPQEPVGGAAWQQSSWPRR